MCSVHYWKQITGVLPGHACNAEVEKTWWKHSQYWNKWPVVFMGVSVKHFLKSTWLCGNSWRQLTIQEMLNIFCMRETRLFLSVPDSVASCQWFLLLILASLLVIGVWCFTQSLMLLLAGVDLCWCWLLKVAYCWCCAWWCYILVLLLSVGHAACGWWCCEALNVKNQLIEITEASHRLGYLYHIVTTL